MRLVSVLFASAGLLFFMVVAKAQTASVILDWNPSSSTNVVGYDVYYGTASGHYSKILSVPGTTNATISGLTNGTTYYIAATAYNKTGYQSLFTSEISVVASATPTPATLTFTSSSPTGGFAFNISGQSGSQYTVQASTNLVNWVALQTSAAPFKFIDTNAGRFNHRFYRAAAN